MLVCIAVAVLASVALAQEQEDRRVRRLGDGRHHGLHRGRVIRAEDVRQVDTT
jgi:hypothetical protein